MALELVAPADQLSQGDLLASAPSVWLEALNPMTKVDRNRYELRQAFQGTHKPNRKHKANASEVRVVGAVLSRGSGGQRDQLVELVLGGPGTHGHAHEVVRWDASHDEPE